MFFSMKSVTSLSSLLVSFTSVDTKFKVLGTMCGNGKGAIADHKYFYEPDITQEDGVKFIV